ncbi:unnamed protein product [Schistosoma margrebowiei]|uniref:Uncharacterized protein n=1 Tax=Schistosoma margrebowiei TaxID=48269 RepID=A0A183N3Q1_9TREM|nr:unnamed protein product [Schistosoma margrebowiei]
MLASDQQWNHSPSVPSGFWDPCAPSVWNQGFPALLGRHGGSTKPVESQNIRFSSYRFRKQHPGHEIVVIDYHKENLRTITTHPTIDVNSKKTTEVNMNSWSSLTSLSTPYISRIEDSETQQVYRSFSAPVDITHTKTGQATLKHQQLILKHPIERTEHKGF